jgi:AcrR family transcriptional regulator
LIHHHFGNKEALFVTAYEYPIDSSFLERALGEGKGTPGERLARAYLSTAFADGRIEALIRSAATNDVARHMLREFLQAALLDAFEDRIEGPDARLRIALAAAQLIGVVVMRRIVEVDAVIAAGTEEIVARVAPVLDHHLGPVASG